MHLIIIDADSLFSKWNNATLRSLKENFHKAVNSNEKNLYDNRIASNTAFWGIQEDSLNRSSVRWKFLEQAKKELHCTNEIWAIIEVIKSGEKVRLINYLICFKAQGEALVIEYKYQQEEWMISKKDTIELRADDMLINTKVLFGKGEFKDDVIVTNFKGEEIKQSDYFLYSTLSVQSKIGKIIESERLIR
jgi:hypothetical protein